MRISNLKKERKLSKFIESSNNIESQKRYFRKIASNYVLDIYNDLYIKYYNRKKFKINNADFVLLKVPFVSNEYILKIHYKLAHLNHNVIRNHLIKSNIYFKGITDKIKNIC